MTRNVIKRLNNAPPKKGHVKSKKIMEPRPTPVEPNTLDILEVNQSGAEPEMNPKTFF